MPRSTLALAGCCPRRVVNFSGQHTRITTPMPPSQLSLVESNHITFPGDLWAKAQPTMCVCVCVVRAAPQRTKQSGPAKQSATLKFQDRSWCHGTIRQGGTTSAASTVRFAAGRGSHRPKGRATRRMMAWQNRITPLHWLSGSI